MNITSYIINLKSSVDRRNYMVETMKPFPFLKSVFVDAVNGKEMSDEEIKALFSTDEAFRHYGREVRPAEVGCTLSHKKCAKALLDSEDKYALVLEDDLIWQTESLELVFTQLDKVLDIDKPVIVLLSGDYWYGKLTPLSGDYKVADVWDAVCAQAYLINRAAAKTLIQMDNWHLADDWYEIRREGIRVKALFHHVADQNRADIKSVIAEKYAGINRKEMTNRYMLRSFWRSFVDKLLVFIGNFEEKNFKW